MAEIAVHPDAAIFPMMSDDELAELAEDIKANGQRFPIIIGKHEDRDVIIDGRNRFAACGMAGVKPKFEQLNGHDPKAFILSANINRRHMTASQRAMAVAMVYPEPDQVGGKREKGSSSLGLPDPPDKGLLSHARKILRNSPQLARAVIAGGTSITDAYAQVMEWDGSLANERSRLRKLREIRPDLAERVMQEEISLQVAEQQAKAEAEARKQQRWAATINLIDGVKLLDRDVETAPDIAADFDPAIVEQRGETFTPNRLRRAAAFLTSLAEIMEKTP